MTPEEREKMWEEEIKQENSKPVSWETLGPWKWLIVIVPVIIAIAFFSNLFEHINARATSAATITNKIGDHVQVGDFSIVIKDVKRNNESVVIAIDATNTGTKIGSLWNAKYVVKDSRDRQFSSKAIRGSLTEDTNPGLTKSGSVSFEIPTDANIIYLSISNGITKYISLK